MEREALAAAEPWRARAVPEGAEGFLPGMLRAQALRTPTAMAVACGADHLTYEQLASSARGIAARLRALGVGPGMPVGLVAERAADTVVGLVGILEAGAAYVPLDPAHPAERIARIAKDAGLAVIVGRTAALTALPEVVTDGRKTVALDHSASRGDEQAAALPAGTDLAYVIYTSGSTGEPKGVEVTHANLLASTLARLEFYEDAPVGSYLLLSPFAFDSSVAGIFWTLATGGTLVVPPEGSQLDADALARIMTAERVTHMLALPSLYRILLDTAPDAALESLRAVIVAGEPCPGQLPARHRARVPRAAFYNEYGITEATVWSTAWKLGPGDPLPPPEAPVPIGRAIPGARLVVLDAAQAPVPVGIPGELFIGGPGVAAGYRGRPALTAERFVPDPFASETGARLYRTGDRVRRVSSGDLEFLGRIDDQIKLRGYRIELGDIEAALRLNPDVTEACAMLREDTPGAPRLVAYAVARGPEPSAADMGRFLGERLPDYMVPGALVWLSALPLTPNGKVDRKKLPAPAVDAAMARVAYVPPSGQVEEAVAEIMADVLGVPRVSVTADFFAMGGSSLLGMRLMARLNGALGVRLSWARLFETPRARDLAALATAALAESSAAYAPIELRPLDAPAPLTHGQELLWLLDRTTPGLVAYNVPLALRVQGDFDASMFATALRLLLERHEALRTAFVAGPAGEPRQLVVPVPADPPVEQADLRSLGDAARASEAVRRVRDFAARPFDLGAGLLIRSLVLRLGETERLVVVVTHHIIFDEWSHGVMARELSALYNGLLRGAAPELPPLPIRYRDYASWQRSETGAGALGPQLAYWRRKLAQLPTLDLPTDRPRQAAPAFAGGRRRFALPPELRDRLAQVARANDATLFMTLLAAFKALLHRYTGQDDIVVGSPITARSRVDLEGLIGFFPNQMVLRTSLAGDPSFRDLLVRVRETCIGGFAHQDVPLEMLVRELRESKNMGQSPLFQVAFLLQGEATIPLSLDGAETATEGTDIGASKFDLTLGLVDGPKGLLGTLEYRSDLFDAATVDRFVTHLEVLLPAIAADQSLPVSRLPLLPDAERLRVVSEWNATAADYPRESTFPELFRRVAAENGTRVAVEAGAARITFAEVDRRADRLAAWLATQGVGPGARVGVYLQRGPQLVPALLAILRSGAAYVPIDPIYPADRAAWMLTDSGAAMVLTEAALTASLPVTASTPVVLDESAWPVGLTNGPPPALPVERAAPDGIAYVIYTSGSTGRPKGAMIRHRGLVNYLWWAVRAYDVPAGEGAPVHSSIAFDLTITGLFVPLLAGRTAILLPDDEGVEALATLLRTRRNLSLVKITPAHLDLLRLQIPAAEAAGRTRRFVIGGENLLGEALAFWQDHAPDTVHVNEYGPTETVVGCCVEEVTATTRYGGAVPIGRPIANTRLYILDRHGEPSPIGIPGELYIGGDGVGLGYLNQPERTAEAFLPDPFASDPSARMYRTGDRARWRAEGRIEFLGRLDEQVKIRGYRIEPGEIEAVLTQHPAVREAAVIAHTDDAGDRRLAAYVVPEPDQLEGAGFAKETVEKWSAVFDETYAPAEAVDPAFNISGWTSSYTLDLIPAEEMREWVERTCERIRALRPRRVLEIGCGTGLLLFRLAPECERYVGVDFSAAALDAVRSSSGFGKLPQVRLYQAAADAIAELDEEPFDAVVINSVAQYFPEAGYLVRVLEHAVSRVRPGGAVFIGDVRSLPLLEAMHASVAVFQAAPETTLAELRDRAAERLRQEPELVVDPAFFHALRLHCPLVTAVEVRPKQSRARNELSKFRYDVVLRIEAGVAGSAAVPDAVPVGDLDAARGLLAGEPAVVALSGVPDRRVARDLQILAALREEHGPRTAADLARVADQAEGQGIEPDDLRDLDPRYDADIYWGNGAGSGTFDAILRHRVKHPERVALPPVDAAPTRPWSDFVHQPHPDALSDAQIAELKRHLSEKLPAYMIPAAFVRLPALPLTPNGKVDRKRLRPPAATRGTGRYTAPRTPREETLAAIWAEVLRLDRVGVEDGFLELAGHSLQAMRILGRVRHEYDVTLPMAMLLRGATIAELAAAIEERLAEPAGEEDEAMVAVPRDPFLRTGGSR
ncbi:MAG: amino acid adenylation domain-containing protein [Gemmatimonadales bacterium]